MSWTPTIRPLAAPDFEAARRLWSETERLGRGPGDSPEALARFVARNPGLSLVAMDGEEIVGAVLCGYDGRRGLIYHLAVAKPFRRRGIAEQLVRRCLAGLHEAGIERCLIMVVTGNEEALRFWEGVGCRRRHDLVPLSIDL